MDIVGGSCPKRRGRGVRQFKTNSLRGDVRATQQTGKVKKRTLLHREDTLSEESDCDSDRDRWNPTPWR